jgi:serine/threonine protein phosphatase PrpC
MPYKVSSVGISDIGLVRQNNEDDWLQDTKHRFYAIADGMGGHQAGEIASHEALKALATSVKNNSDLLDDATTIDEARKMILDAIEDANSHVYKLSRSDAEFKGMGTTLCCLFFHPRGLIYAHVGDSRIYRLRGKKLQQLTKDHSLLQELMDLGKLSDRQAGEFLHKNIITEAIGTQHRAHPSVRVTDIQQDLLLMCTDGLTDLVTRDEIEAILNRKAALRESANALVNAAKERGGHDNITVLLVKVQQKHEPKGLSR